MIQIVSSLFIFISLFLAMIRSKLVISETEFRDILNRWIQINGAPKGLIVRKAVVKPMARTEPDLVEYSFDRAVICDRARTVDLLIANNFHFENNCAVLAARGYPENIFATVQTMLRRNNRLKVFVLHDATPVGCALAHKLANDLSWFKGIGTVIDVGLRPEHAKSIKVRPDKALHPVVSNKGISVDESAWLAKYSLELAVIPPDQVIKRLFRAISAPIDKNNASNYAKGDGYLIDRKSFAVVAGASDGGGDSFG